jgi:hypothetical protein
MQRKLLGIINVDFDTTGQLLIMHSAFIKYLRKNGNTMKQCIIYLLMSSKHMIQLGGRFCIIFSMKLVRLIKMCLSEIYKRVWVGKHLPDIFPFRNGLKQGDAESPLLFNFALEYAGRRVQVNQDGLKLNSTHHILVHAHDVNILGRRICTMQENAVSLISC